MICRTCHGKGWVEGYGDEAPRIGPNRVYAIIEVPCPDCGPQVCGCGEPATHEVDGYDLCDDCYTTGPLCTRCDGTGEMHEQRCSACHGRGEGESPADRESRESRECAEEEARDGDYDESREDAA